MKKRILLLVLLMLLSCLLPGCAGAGAGTAEDEPVWLNMNTAYAAPTTLPDGGGQRVRVILLLGQSNATGCGLNSYLKKNLGDAAYEKYESGFRVWKRVYGLFLIPILLIHVKAYVQNAVSAWMQSAQIVRVQTSVKVMLQNPHP